MPMAPKNKATSRCESEKLTLRFSLRRASTQLSKSPAAIKSTRINRAQDTLTIPLCPLHHTGADGIHGLGRKGFYARYKKDELDYLAETLERLEP